MEKLKGPFFSILPNFQKYKKSLGYKYNNINSYYALDKILAKHKIYDLSDTFQIYEILVTNEQNQNKKISNYNCLKQLYKYLKNTGYRKELYFKEFKLEYKSDFKPIILTSRQINIFFNTLDNYCKNSLNENYKVYPILFRLLYSCGLRINEALNLKSTDYSKENGTIYIFEAKENVTRELPLSNSMNKILSDYKSHQVNNYYLFEINNNKISKNQVYTFFMKILNELNFKFRIHDIRHTYSVTIFNKLYKKGYDEFWILYYLHIYLGHKRWESTEHYLQFTSNHLKKAVKQCSTFYSKVCDDDE